MGRDNEDSWSDDDFEDDEQDDGSAVCPYCGADYYEEAGYCPACERWINREDLPRRPMPVWARLLILMCLLGLVLSVLRGF